MGNLIISGVYSGPELRSYGVYSDPELQSYGSEGKSCPLGRNSQVTASGSGIQVSRELWSYVIQTFTFRASFLVARNF